MKHVTVLIFFLFDEFSKKMSFWPENRIFRSISENIAELTVFQPKLPLFLRVRLKERKNRNIKMLHAQQLKKKYAPTTHNKYIHIHIFSFTLSAIKPSLLWDSSEIKLEKLIINLNF